LATFAWQGPAFATTGKRRIRRMRLKVFRARAYNGGLLFEMSTPTNQKGGFSM
jgi:hypothetical protein